VKLTVTAGTGQSSSSDSGLVSVKDDFSGLNWTVTNVMAGDVSTVTFASLPANAAKVYVKRGDGIYKAVYNSPWAATVTMPPHTYTRYTSGTPGYTAYHKADVCPQIVGEQPGFLFAPRASIYNSTGSVIQGKALPNVTLLDGAGNVCQ
jgi:hypothetical protein